MKIMLSSCEMKASHPDLVTFPMNLVNCVGSMKVWYRKVHYSYQQHHATYVGFRVVRGSNLKEFIELIFTDQIDICNVVQWMNPCFLITCTDNAVYCNKVVPLYHVQYAVNATFDTDIHMRNTLLTVGCQYASHIDLVIWHKKYIVMMQRKTRILNELVHWWTILVGRLKMFSHSNIACSTVLVLKSKI